MSSFLNIIFKNYSFRQAISAEVEEAVGFLVRNLPGVVGFVTRFLAYKMFFACIGSIPYIYPGVRFVFMGHIRLGKNVAVNSNTYIYGKGGVDIGDNVLISPNCSIVAGDHNVELGRPIIEQASKTQKIVIEKDCWIGANSVVVGGVTIREGSIIGAGAVVTHDTEPYSINIGIPARKVKKRE